MAKEVVEDLSNVEYLNVEEVNGLAEATYYGVMATPSIILIDDNENEVCSWRGDVPAKEELKEWI